MHSRKSFMFIKIWICNNTQFKDNALGLNYFFKELVFANLCVVSQLSQLSQKIKIIGR